MATQACRVAFSIHGTNTFIVATKSIDTAKLPVGFMIEKSRNPNSTGVKLIWEELFTKAGNPLKSPSHILNRFKKLEVMGWAVNDEAFIYKHYHSKWKKASGQNK